VTGGGRDLYNHQCYENDKIKEDEMGRVCSAHVGDE
jgi:hypothetical protein